MPILLVLLAIVIVIAVAYYFAVNNRFQCPRCRNTDYHHNFSLSERKVPLTLGKEHNREITVQQMKCKQCLYSWEMAYKIIIRPGGHSYICEGCGNLHNNYVNMGTMCWWEIEE